MNSALSGLILAYHKHDVNVILNDHVIAQLTDVIPEGLYRFPVRPQDLKVGADAAHPNDVRLEMLHLRGGHYVVSSDFDLTIRISQVSRYVVADSPQEAQKVLRESAQLCSTGVDLAVYANAFRADPVAPKANEVTTIRGDLPKGDHRIVVRARDTSGLTTEQARLLKCN